MSMPEELVLEEIDREPREMSESEVISAVDQEYRWANDLLQDDLSANRTRAWDYFRGRPRIIDEDTDERFNDIVSRDVADAIESTLAEILPAFATDRPAEFDPSGPGDEEQAALESDICNDILMEAGSGYLELVTAAKNALLLRLGAIEIQWQDREEISYQQVDNATPEMLAIWQQDPNIEIREVEQTAVVDMQTGAAMGQMSVELRMRRRVQKCVPQAVPVDELLISSDATSTDLNLPRFVGRQKLVPRSDLVAEGYPKDVIDGLTAYTTTTSQRSRSARERNTWGREKRSGDHATDLIMVLYAYYRLDEDRDGIAERRRIVLAGTPGGWTLLEDEPIDYQPYAAGSAYLWPHQPHGVSLYDKLKHVQDLKTQFWRIMLEAGQRSARDRTGVLPGTDLDQVLTTQFGGVFEMSTPNGVISIPNPRFPGELTALQGFADKARREGGGGAVDKSAAENMPVEAGSHAVERMMTAIEELNAMVAQMLAETLVKQSYEIIHNVLRLYSPPIPRKVNGQWIQIDPRQWQPRDKVTIATGLTMSARSRLASAYESLLSKQMTLMEKGSTLVNETSIYRLLTAQARMMGIQHPTSYLVDPNSQEGQQAKMQKAQQAQQAQQSQQQAQQAQMQAQAQIAAMIEQARGSMRLQQEAMKQQGDAAKMQADMAKAMAELREDQRQFNATLEQKYDALRVQLVEIEAKHGEQEERGPDGQVLDL